MTGFAVALALILGVVLGLALGYLLARSRTAAAVSAAAVRTAQLQGELQQASSQVAALELRRTEQEAVGRQLAPMATALAELDRRVIAAERDRTAAAAALEQMLKEQSAQSLTAAADVKREAGRLAKALSHTHRRGTWGEAELRRLVEAAGMLEKVHFDSQVTVKSADEHLRPDMVIHLAGGRSVVVDAKAPLDALVAVPDDDSDAYSPATLKQHAKAVRDHVDALAKRNYAGMVQGSAHHVVLYLPAESLLSLALAADPVLLDHAFGKGVTIATPTTMMALLRSVGQYWRDEAVAENAARIRDEGVELHKRLMVMASHFSKLGRSLNGAVEAFNSTVGSYENRVLPSTRRFRELGLVQDDPATPPAIETAARTLRVAGLEVVEQPPTDSTGEAAG